MKPACSRPVKKPGSLMPTVQSSGRVSDSGEGRWTIMAAAHEAVPAPVLSAELYERFGSRGEPDFAHKVLSALRYEFGGHQEETAMPEGGA